MNTRSLRFRVTGWYAGLFAISLVLFAAAIYFGLSYPASIFAGWLERKLQYDHR